MAKTLIEIRPSDLQKDYEINLNVSAEFSCAVLGCIPSIVHDEEICAICGELL